MSFRNLPKVQLIGPGELNAYDVLCNEYIVFTKDLVPASVAADKAGAAKPQRRQQARSREDAAAEPADRARHRRSRHRTARAAALRNDDGSEPKGFPIKGNADSMLFHGPDSPYYSQTVAEVWFATEEAAEAAGFSKPASVPAAEEAAADDDDTKEGA